ncbi:MAG: hypothetical protein V4467_00935 [Patescibacteria group bacterium]
MEENIAIGGNLLLPLELHQWSCRSRRIYSVTSELQQFLETTSTKHITWNDVTLPFDSFGIALSIPLKSFNRGESGVRTVTSNCDFILVTRQSIPEKRFTLLIRQIAIDPNYVHPAKGLRQHIDELLQSGKYSKASTILEERIATIRASSGYMSLLRLNLSEEEFNSPLSLVLDSDPMVLAHPLASSEAKEYGETEIQSVARLSIRIVVGLCLYLESLGTKSKGKGKLAEPIWERQTSTDPRTLVSESQVLTVTGENLLSAQDERLYKLTQEKGLAQALKEMGAHFRCAHWRRPPGKGDDGSALKTVHVKSCFVRPDRLPPEGLPPGTEMQVV